MNTFIVHAQNVFFKLSYTKIIWSKDVDDTNSLVWLQAWSLPNNEAGSQDLRAMLETLVLGLEYLELI